MFTVTNHEGVRTDSSYIIYDKEQVYAFDAIGAEVAVKAIHAAAFGNSKRFAFDGKHDSERLYAMQRKLADLAYAVDRQTLLTQPNLYRWHLRPVVRPGDLGVIVYGLSEWPDFDEPTGCYWAMLQTNYPTLREWAPTLLDLGRQAGLVRDLAHVGSVTFAFELQVSEDWQALLDTAVRAGRLRIPTA
jgi:hypothetical protein